MYPLQIYTPNFVLINIKYLFINKDVFKKKKLKEEKVFRHHCCEAVAGNYSFEMFTLRNNYLFAAL